MEVTAEDLKQRYESLQDDELIDLHLNSELTEIASSVLKDVLAARGITEDRVKDYMAKKNAKKTEPDRPGIVTVTLPKMWIGYVFVVAQFLYVFVQMIIAADPVNEASPLLWFIAAAGYVYWLFCVQRIHKIIEQFTTGMHPISPSKAVGFHFIPFYNLYWIFKWPNEVSNFVNKNIETKSMSKGWPGFFLLLSFFLGRFVDTSLALIAIFTVGYYINKKIRSVVKSDHGNLVTATVKLADKPRTWMRTSIILITAVIIIVLVFAAAGFFLKRQTGDVPNGIAQFPKKEDSTKVRISAIVVKKMPDALEILQKLDKGSDFAELANQYSIGPGKGEGGDMGYFSPGEMMEKLDAVAVNLKVGEYSEIVETNEGYFILMKTEMRQPKR